MSTVPADEGLATEQDWADHADDTIADLLVAAREDSASAGGYAEVAGAIERHQASLAQLRKARRLTQEQLAALIGVNQAQVSRLERRVDLNVMLSTLRAFVEATGGELHIIVTYPDDPLPIELTGAAAD